MLMQQDCGPKTAASPPRARTVPIARAARYAVLPLGVLFLVASLTAGCGSASTPLEKYQNCLKCGYDFAQPIPTAGLEDIRRPKPGLVAFGRDDPS